MKLPVDKLLALNDTLIYYQGILDELVIKLQASKPYSREEGDCIKKIRAIERWVNNIKLTKERLYANCTN